MIIEDCCRKLDSFSGWRGRRDILRTLQERTELVINLALKLSYFGGLSTQLSYLGQEALYNDFLT